MNALISAYSSVAQTPVEWPRHGAWPFVAGIAAVAVFLWWTAQSKDVPGRLAKRRFPILYGADGRRSTSTLVAFTWTAALAFGAVTLCMAAILNDLPLADVGLDALPEEYLVLLAVPYGSLVAAKLITQSKVEGQTIVKATPAAGGTLSGPTKEGGFTAGDRGQTSLQDVQYLTFNALLLVYFVVALWASHALPALPLWLVGLTGAAGATFVAGKAVESETPEIASVTKNGNTLHVRGKHLHQPVLPAQAGHNARECVTVDNHDVRSVNFLGEQGFDVELDGPRQAGEKLTVVLLGGIILTDQGSV